MAPCVEYAGSKNTLLDFRFCRALKARPHGNFAAENHELAACEPTKLLSNCDFVDLEVYPPTFTILRGQHMEHPGSPSGRKCINYRRHAGLECYGRLKLSARRSKHTCQSRRVFRSISIFGSQIIFLRDNNKCYAKQIYRMPIIVGLEASRAVPDLGPTLGPRQNKSELAYRRSLMASPSWLSDQNIRVRSL